MLQNLFLCPIELFEAYPIGRCFSHSLNIKTQVKTVFRILNRLSCDMFVIDQKLPSCLQVVNYSNLNREMHLPSIGNFKGTELFQIFTLG